MRKRGVVLVIAATALIVAVGGVRALAPQTACNVSYAQYNALPMKISYDKAKALFGCDGVLVSREDDKPAIETYEWRGAAWLYSRVQAVFIDNSLEEKSVRWSDIVTWTEAVETTDEGHRYRTRR